MRLFLFLIASLAFGQAPVITQGPFVANTSRSSFTVTWTTDIPATTSIKSDVGDGTLVESLAAGAGDASLYYIHTWFVSGKPAATAISYQACSTANTQQTCSSTATFTTPAGSAIADPIPPTPVDAPVTPTGAVHTVGASSASCDDATDGLVALWASVPRGDIVEIPPTTTCAGTYTFPARADGPPYILTRVQGVAATLPPGRRSSPADRQNMARFVNNAPNLVRLGAGDPTSADCFYQNYGFRFGQGSAFAVYRCENVNPQTITGITPSGNLRVTVPGHGITDGVMGAVKGSTGAGAATFVDQGWRLHVIDANTIELQPYILYPGPVQATGMASGGQLYVNAWRLLSHADITGALPTSCAWGAFYQKTDGSADETHRTFYCNNLNELIPFRVDTVQPAGWYTLPVIDLTTNKPNYLMFDGLHFEPLNLKGDGSMPQYGYQESTQPTGNSFNNFIIQSSAAHHIYWDHINGVCPDPTLSGFMGRCVGFALGMNGSHWRVRDSFFSGFQSYHVANSIYDGNSYVFPIYTAGPHEFLNTYMGCAGICVFWPDDEASFTTATDLTFTGNTIETPDKYWGTSSDSIGSPAWLGNGMYWSQRHRFEHKRIKRARIEGNVFTGGWVWNNNASAVCLCTRGGTYGAQISNIADTAITIYGESAVSQTSVFNNLHVGDKVAFAGVGSNYGCGTPIINRQLYTVASIVSPTSITVTPGLGCAGTFDRDNLGKGFGGGGYIVRAMSDSNYISDVLIRHNTIQDSPTGIFTLGHDSYSSPNSQTGVPSSVQQRVRIENNLMLRIDQGRRGLGSGGPHGAGSVITGQLGFEDFKVIHNTAAGQTPGGYFFAYTSDAYGMLAQGSGLLLSDNLFDHVQDPYGAFANGATSNQSWGDLALSVGWTAMTPHYTAQKNAVMRAGGSSGVTGQYVYPASTSFFNGTSATFPFVGPGNYRIQPGSPFAAGGASQASDGTAVGANIDALEAAQGTAGGAHFSGSVRGRTQ